MRLLSTIYLISIIFYLLSICLSFHQKSYKLSNPIKRILLKEDDFEDDFNVGIQGGNRERLPISKTQSSRRAFFSGLKNREGLTRAVAAGLFIAGIGTGIAVDSAINTNPKDLASRDAIDRNAPNPKICILFYLYYFLYSKINKFYYETYDFPRTPHFFLSGASMGSSAMVLDQRVFITFNPFNVYVTQADTKPGCVLRQSNVVNLLQKERNLVSDEEMELCKISYNTWAFVGDLNNKPQLNCVYQSDDAQNEFLSNPKVINFFDLLTIHFIRYYIVLITI